MKSYLITDPKYYTNDIDKFKNILQNNIKDIFINSDITLASQLKATGVHLTSTQFENIKDAKRLDLKKMELDLILGT